MLRGATRSFVLASLVTSLAAPVAYAQGGPVAEPPPAASSSAASAAEPPSPTVSSATNDRPARGPALRERGGRRSRGSGTASGALFLAVLVGAMGYYVVKKLRR